MTSRTPVRTLAVTRTAGEIRWAVLAGELPRLGDDERGLPASAEPQRALAASVVNRLLSGSGGAERPAGYVPEDAWARIAVSASRTALTSTGRISSILQLTGEPSVRMRPNLAIT